VTAVFFDKTGTLTRGEFRVVEMTTRAGLGQGEALALATAVLSIPGVVVGPCERVIHSSSDVGGASPGSSTGQRGFDPA
jgi:magnesium-transporting ATPase (P-type)